MRRTLLAVLCVTALVHAGGADSPAGPRLTVVLVVDQMRADYLTAFAPRWRAGFRTLLSRGTSFTHAEYPYWNTITCAGHASIATGTLPRTHGMILNRWWDRAERRIVNCNDDPQATPLSYQRPAAAGSSGKRLLVTTFADELRAQRPGARVVSLSLKPRSAIGLAGHGGDAVVWFDDASRSFITSMGFATAPVPEVAQFMASHSFDADAPTADRWQKNPKSDAYLASLATWLVDRWKLGQRDATDFLGISFSALDTVGHDFGPGSREIEEVLFGLDTTIGTLIDHLDRTVGRDRYVLAVSADHGVAAIPEKNGGGRVANEDVGTAAEQALVAQWGPPAAGRYVAASVGAQIYLADGVFDRLRASPAAMHMLERALLAMPGVARIVRRDQLDRDDPITSAIAQSYFEARSGDLFVVPRRDWIVETRADGDATTHGTHYEYDRRVPLLLVGAGFPPGPNAERVTPLDIAPTLAALTGVTLANRDGRALVPRPPAGSAAAASGPRGTPR
jgi:predicted AlkP superfamily pyrophosphatase or phosphodiesterase